MPLERTSLEKRVSLAEKNQIGDINLMTDVLNKICGMSLEDYI